MSSCRPASRVLRPTPIWLAGAGILCAATILSACANGDTSGFDLNLVDGSSSKVDGGVDSSQPDTGSGAVDSSYDATSPTDSAGSDDATEEELEASGGDVVTEAAVDARPEAAVEASADATSDSPPPPVDGGCTLTSCGAHSVCSVGACVAARRVFVSSAVYSASLGGHAGADTTCQQLATAAGLGGTWMAWASDSASSPSARFTQATVEYALVTGAVVASGWSGLTSGTLGGGIDVDENGQPVQGTTEVWTATATDGTLFEDGCTSFTSTSSSDVVEVGISGASDDTWTEVYEQFCSRTVHLYCFEQ